MMAITKIPEFSFKHVDQPDRPTATAAEIKANFDSRAKNIRDTFNDTNVIELTEGAYNYAASTTGTDAYAVTITYFAAYTAGATVKFKADVANTGACTLNVNGLGAKAIKLENGSDPTDGVIKAGAIVTVVYDGTNFQIVTTGLAVVQANLITHQAETANLNDYPIVLPEVDDTGRLQRAIDSGKNVIIPEGTYYHSTLIFRNNTRLIGRGDSTLLINTNNASSIQIASAEAIMSTLVQNIKMLGDVSKPNNHAIEFVGVNAAYCVIDRVFIQGFGGHGIYGGHVGHVNNVEIKGCFIRGCTGDGINTQYGVGQINAIWIHHNNIVGNNNGILFFGNNVIVEKNTIQANRNYGISLSNRTLDTVKACYGSSIINNYFELNASAVSTDASIIGIFTCWDTNTPGTNKVLRSLIISGNYFCETASKYISIIYCEDLKNSHYSDKNCVISCRNNYGHFKLFTYNKTSALSEGTVIDESHPFLVPSTMTLTLPQYVEIRGAWRLPTYNNCRWMKSVILANSPHKGKKFVVTLYSTNPSFNNSETFGRSILNVKVTGMYDFGITARFTTDCTYYEPAKFCTSVVVNLGADAANTPTVSPITRVAFTNGDGFQFTVTPSTIGGYAAFLDFTCLVESEFKYLAIDVAEVAL